MALYPIKVLQDKNRQPFIPFITSDAIVVNGSDQTVADMFDDRYTKTEVDAIIQSLGTIQRLCGKVDTRSDLDNIQNPQAGDTYIVGTSTTNNSEWMWIGTSWEQLGPMIDLTGYYTKTEINSMLTNYATVSDLNTVYEMIGDINTILATLAIVEEV